MGCYERNGAFYITSKPRDSRWPQLTLPTSATSVERLQFLDRLINDELRGGGRLDLAWALKHKHLTLDQLAALVGDNIKNVHHLSARALGLPVTQLPLPGGGDMLTFGEVVQSFVANARKVKKNQPLSPQTIARYQQSFACMARHLGNGDADAGYLCPAVRLWDVGVLDAYSKARRNPNPDVQIGHAQREPGAVAAATVNRDHRAFGALRAHAMRTHPTLLVGLVEPAPTLQEEGNYEEHLLADGEFEAILDYCDVAASKPAPKSRAITVRDWVILKFMLLVLYWTGARVGEMLRMRWRQWQLDEVDPYVLLEGHSELGDKHERRLSVPPPLVEGMRAWRELAKARGWRTDQSAPVWKGPLVNQGTFQKAWDSLRKSLTDHPNIAAHRLHDFRHDAAVGWVRAGASIEEVRQALGHADRDVTYRYTKFNAGTMQQAGLRRAAMHAMKCKDPLLAALLCDPVRAEEIVTQLIAAHPKLQRVVVDRSE